MSISINHCSKYIQKYQDVFTVVFLVIAFVVIRSLHFSTVVNFSADQGTFSLRAFELWQNKEITLVGPTASIQIEGRQLIQSSVIYYTFLLLYLATGFDPLNASYLFMLLAATGVPALYLGLRKVSNWRTAVFATASYVFVPLFVNYTRFLWNPNFQLALAPWLIFCLSQTYFAHKRERKTQALMWIFASGFVSGVMLLFHYQMVLGLLLVCFFLWQAVRARLRAATIFGVGFALGAAPLLLFEINSHGYLLKTVLLYLQKSQPSVANSSFAFPAHYATSLVLLVLVWIVFASRKKIQLTSNLIFWAAVSCIVSWSLVSFVPKPSTAFGMVTGWNYSNENTAHSHIAKYVTQHSLTNYAIANTLYETNAPVQYFLLQKNNLAGATNDFLQNNYLFVITQSDGSGLQNNPAYEIATFQPNAEVRRWQLTDEYDLFLLQRLY